MLSEIAVLCIIVGLVAVLWAGAVIIDARRQCKHDFTNWQFTSTPGAFVQLRQCRKCGYTEVDQIKRVGEKHES